MRHLHGEKDRVEAKFGTLAKGADFAAQLLTSVQEEMGKGYATVVARLQNPSRPVMVEELAEVDRGILQKAD